MSLGNPQTRYSGNGKKLGGKSKKWKPRKEEDKMVLGRGVGWEGVVGLSLRALVGKFSYKAMNYTDIEAWASAVWAPIIGYRPTISILQKGWYGFVFRQEKHATYILQRT